MNQYSDILKALNTAVQKVKKTKTILRILLVFVCLLTIGSTFLAFKYFRAQKINSLGQLATSFGVAIGTKDISNLAGDRTDLTNPSYISLKEKLMKLQQFNSDTRFTYLMGQRGEDILFYADSEDPHSPDYSPPGQVYSEASDTLRSVFTKDELETEVSADRWGKWMSVMAPVIDYHTGSVKAMVGFDIPYNVYLREVILFSSLPLSVGLIILVLLIAAYLYVKKEEDLMLLRSEYFAIAAHDLRTPLNGIRFAIDSLQKNKAKSESVLAKMSHSTDNMLLSVNELLDSSALEKTLDAKLQISKINIIPIIRKNIDAHEISTDEKKLKVSIQTPIELMINGDKDKLSRVFANLISNAIKYSKPNGSIKITAKKSDGRAVVTVKDSGIGIPVKDQGQIFSGYYRANNAKEFTTQGTGLGLYYVKNIIDLHLGNIKLISVPGKGTEITVSFPLI